ncbi:MAG: 2,3-diketo-5-methylthio-1-phosphopentane phosphatase, partial [Deltaproteobacteria bacterium]|nr:2,3-diketo-5-methylthio-1-phosphopentane phosphatase [Deltaproteobacteria bacterium]
EGKTTKNTGGRRLMRAPINSPYYCPETGIDTRAVVRFHLEHADTVAYAGDGFTDVPAALLVAPERRFARASLARTLRERGEPFRPFAVWSDVARTLLNVAAL